VARAQLPKRLSRELVDTFRACNPAGFAYVPRAARVLTKPSTPVGNEGQDNCQHDLLLAVNDALVAPNGRRRDTPTRNARAQLLAPARRGLRSRTLARAHIARAPSTPRARAPTALPPDGTRALPARWPRARAGTSCWRCWAAARSGRL
jgi:hypothetical protein